MDPDGPLPTDSRWPDILAVARRFAAADADYETGRLSPAIRRTIRRTCTPGFARELLENLPVLAAGVRGAGLDEHARSVAPLEKLPGRAQVLVEIGRIVDGSDSSGALELTLVQPGRGWLVSDLSVLS